jgi:hypothetical protein
MEEQLQTAAISFHMADLPLYLFAAMGIIGLVVFLALDAYYTKKWGCR